MLTFRNSSDRASYGSLNFMMQTSEAAATRSVLKKDVLKNFAKFTGKHLCQRCQSLFFNKVAGLNPC